MEQVEVTTEQAETLDKLVEEVNTDDAPSKEDVEEPYISFSSKKAFQDAIDSRLRERMERMERQQAEDKAQAESKARQQALEENQQYKELAEDRQGTITELTARVEELSPYKESFERYKGVVDSQLEAQKKNLPGYISSLLEGKDSVEQLNWLRENREEIAQEKPSGSRPTPNPSDAPDDRQADKAAAEAQRAQIGASL